MHLMESPDKSIKDADVVLPVGYQMLAQKHNDEKPAIALLIVGTGLVAYRF